ncbi:WD repeats region domain-containing protein [Linnemannia hyalina]|uniref:WD repeats region domain-containing protein n=1 Tax=Linnemannia hyalina TaxID=64524 RepID=A0A9P7XP03_9FUNG|nr:WD repeats region domain-containing protein [Linnemannia hyalina]
MQTHAIGDEDDPSNKQHANSFHGIEIDVQDTEYLEDDLCNLRLRRLGELQQLIYILPMAKANLQAQDDDIFSLKEKVQEFLASQRQVMLILGDSGAGKSTFNRHLEHQLWTDYKQGGPIPLYINLPTIDDPEHDLIEKQLQHHYFSKGQIQEMKQHRQFILICDGYDESQLKINIHTTNQFNQPGQWKSKMVISCRSQFLESDYRSRFQPQPIDRDQSTWTNLFQEAVIAPFSKEQIEEYVTCYVPLEPRPWVTEDYMRMLTTIPNLMDLVKIPFLLTLALEALPSIAEGKQDLSTVRVTRVQLFDIFVERWLHVNKRRLQDNDLSQDHRRVFNELLGAGFVSMGTDYAMRLALAIFERQNGTPIVQYTHFHDHDTWKEEFFGTDPVVRLLQESCPLTRTGNQFRFLHRSMQEYFFSRVVYNPVGTDDDSTMETEAPSSTPHEFDPSNPLFRHNLLTEPSVIQFLCDRVKLDSTFNQQLLSVVNLSKTDAAVTTTTGATNAMTILVRAGVAFHDADFRGVKIPGADLSAGQFDYAQFQGADLTGVNLTRSWLREADLSSTMMEGVQFGELPCLKLDDNVVVCTYLSDGRTLAVGAGRWVVDVSIYDTSSWTRTYSFTGWDEAQTTAFSPDGTRVVFGGRDGVVRLWDCTRGHEISGMEGHQSDVNSVAFSPCGEQIASAGDDQTVRLWDSYTEESLFVLEGHTSEVLSVKYSPSGEWLVSGGSDGTIRFWNSETREVGIVLDSSLGDVRTIAFSTDGRWIVSGHGGGGLQLWHAVSGEPGPVLHGHTRDVTGVAFSPNSRWIASSSLDGTVRLWDASTGTHINTLSGHMAEVNDVVFSPDGLQIASGGDDSRVRLWDVDSILTSSVEQLDQFGAVGNTVYSSNGQYILTVDNCQTVKQWDSLTGAPVPLPIALPGHVSVKSVSYSLDDIPTAVVDRDGTLRLCEFQAGSPKTILEGSGKAKHVAMSPCCRWIASTDRDNTVMLWNLNNTQRMHVLIENGGVDGEEINCLAFSTTGHQLAIGTGAGNIWLFDPQSKGLITSISTHRGIEAMSFSPEGQQLAVGTEDYLIYLWGLQSEERAIELRGHTEELLCIAYSLCSEWIASGDLDKTVRVWRRQRPPGDTESWSCVSTLHCYFDIVIDIAWSPTVRMEFVTGCRDGSVRVWRVSSDGEDVVVKLLWGTNLGVLQAEGLVLKGTTGLGFTEQKLLVQCGAIDDSLTLEEDGRSDVEE